MSKLIQYRLQSYEWILFKDHNITPRADGKEIFSGQRLICFDVVQKAIH